MKPQPKNHKEQRPLTGNPTGKYNMNFIDQTNDLASYSNGDISPQLQELINSYFQTITWSQTSNVKNHFQPAINLCKSQLFQVNHADQKKKERKNQKEQKQKQIIGDHCAVCTQKFIQNEQVKVLPCKHCFHKECIKPWFQVNSKCPNCRFDLYEGK